MKVETGRKMRLYERKDVIKVTTMGKNLLF